LREAEAADLRDYLAALRGAGTPSKRWVRPRLEEKRRDMHYQCKNPEDLLKTIKDEKIKMIDVRFTDIPNLWQHFSVPPRALDENAIVEGVGFDGSSIRGFQEIQESDMLVMPDPTTAFLDPFAEAPTLSLICNIRDPVNR
jgi:glutamine synthetase